MMKYAEQLNGTKYDVNASGNHAATAVGPGARATINHYSEIIIRADNFEDQPPVPGEPPYKGLAYFTEADKDIFFGRKQLSNRLANRLQTSHFLALIGASGSGKSSLLRAGIIPRLRTHNWRIHVIKPGVHPLTALATTLTPDTLMPTATKEMLEALSADSETLSFVASKLSAQINADRFLLIVDQFEELFTQCKDAKEQAAFVANLTHAARAQSATTVLISMRADFYNRVSAFPVLTDLVSQQQAYIKPLSESGLVRVIAEPAKRGGWQFAAGLVEQIVEDVGREPGRLPLLSHALLETWERRRGVVMTLGGYRGAGGVEGAIAQTAQETFQHLIEKNPDFEAVTREIFLDLTELGEGAEDTRRVANLAELAVGVEESTLSAVLETLVHARLITTGKDGEIEVAHEALIRRWPMLREWLEDNRGRLRFERQLTRDALHWDELARDDGSLYRGVRLAQAVELVENGGVKLNTLSTDFLSASRELVEREKLIEENRLQRELEREHRLKQRNLMLFLGALSVVMVLVFRYLILPRVYQAVATRTGELVELSHVGVAFEAYEVNNERYRLCVEWGNCDKPNNFNEVVEHWNVMADDPVVGIDVTDAAEFCAWIGRTLPTVEQWLDAAPDQDN